MTQQPPYPKGQSAIIMPVSAADHVVSYWRRRYNQSAQFGMPSHSTVLYPFLDEHSITDQTLASLRQDAAMYSIIKINFQRVASFPGYLYLDPEPADWLRLLISRFADRWPQTPRYGVSQHQKIVPHLTVAEGTDNVLDEVRRELEPELPFAATLDRVELCIFDGQHWCVKEQFPFLGLVESTYQMDMARP